MSELTKYKSPLTFIAILVLAKFVWLPMWDLKEASWQEYKDINNTQAKTLALVGLAEEMQGTHLEAQKILEQVNHQILSTNNLTKFKLTVQAGLGDLFVDYNLNVTTLSWRDGIEADGVKQLFVDLNVNGKMRSFLSISTQLKEKLKQVELTKLKLNIQRQTEDSLGLARGNLTLKLSVRLINDEDGG